jgi:uncharacterized protein YcfJ
MIGVATPSFAHRGDYNGYYNQDRNYYYNDDRDYRDNRDYRREADYNRERNYRGQRCNNNGTGGTIIGAIAGGLFGREVVGHRGDRTAGAIVGAGVGALAGRAIDRAGNRRC